MIQFRKYKLRELGSMKNGANYPKGSYGKGIKIVNVKDLFKGRFVPDNELDELKENILKDDSIYTVEHGDILFTRSSLVRSGAGMCAMINNPNQKILFCGFIIRFRIFEKNRFYPLYLLYMLRSPAYRALFTGSQQTCITNINQDTLGDIEVYIPIDENGDIDFNKQVELVNSLNSIDDKIALNNKTNSELENMAKTVYDYWFTQFDFPDANGNPYKTSGGKMEYNQVLKREIPVGWEVGKLSEIADIYNGSTPSTKENDNYGGDIVWITPKDLSDQQRKFTWYGERNITEKGYKDCNTTLIPEGSILLSSRAPIGLISIAACELCTNQGFKNIVPRNMENRYYLYSVIDSNIPKIEQLGSGTTFKEVSKQSMEDFKIIIPSEQIIRIYNEHIKPIFENQLKIIMEIDELTKLRDYLLPLLMNGQIEVK